MDSRQVIIDVIFEAIDQANQQLAPEVWVKKSPDTIILGPSSPFDSLGFINFVAAVEEGCEERFRTLISLTEAGMAESDVPASVSEVADLIIRLLAKKGTPLV